MKAVISKMEERMNKCIDSLDRNFKTVRAGRANAAVLDKVMVEYYGTPTPINQMAAISTPDPRTLQIAPWDKNTLKEIEKAIQMSDLGINPQNDGTVIRLTFPTLTEERRKELAKDIRRMAEDAKIAVRNCRRDGIDGIKALKKNNEITEDEQADGEKLVQKSTDKFVAEIDGMCANKEKEILAI